MIELRPVDARNRDAVCALRVRPEQEELVADNEFSLGQAELQPACVPLAVCEGETPVGFVMYGVDPDDGEYWIYRVMIDAAFQGRGCGRAAMERLLARIGAEGPGRDVYISFEKGNAAASALYASLGFKPDCWSADGEEVWCRRARPVCVRDMAPGDAPALAAMSAEWAASQISWGFYADSADYFAKYRGFVACGGDGAPCGYLLGELRTAKNMTSILPDGARYFEIEELYVMPAMRGQGLGAALFRHMKHVVMAEEEAEAVLLSTSTKDYEKILRFYIKQMGMTFWSARLFLPL